MGLIFQANQGLLKGFPEETKAWGKALIEPGRIAAAVKLAALSADEVEVILLKLDQMAQSKNNEAIATMLAEEAESILLAVRMVKMETKEPFMGILGVGANLDMQWLRPRHVGDSTLMNTDNTAGLGLYGGANNSIYRWTNPLVADTWATIIPSQKMAEEAAVVHMGAIDPIEVPKVNAIEFQLAGITIPVQSVEFNIRPGFGLEHTPTARFEKPVIVGPEKTQRVRVKGGITGDTKFQLLSVLIAKAESLTN